MVLAQWLHFMGVGAWIGGLAWLFLGLFRRLEPAKVRRFSTLAGVALAVVVVSGLLRSWNELGVAWWLHPFRNGYSTTLALKVAIVIPLIGLGALNRYRNVPRYGSTGSRPMLRTVGGELALAAAVLLATGVLTGLPPKPNEEPAGPAARPLVVTGADFATTTRVRLEVSPGTVGPNTFVADVTDYDTGEQVDARRVSLTFDLPDQPDVSSTLRLQRSQGRWQGAGNGARAARHLDRDGARRAERGLGRGPAPGDADDAGPARRRLEGPGPTDPVHDHARGRAPDPGLRRPGRARPNQPGPRHRVRRGREGAPAARGHALDHAPRGHAVRAEDAAVRARGTSRRTST
jgi:hypothetical protein